MTRQQYKKLLTSLPSLTRGQQQRLLDKLKTSLDQSDGISLIETRLESTKSCPHCSSSCFQRWGKRHDLQRYRCKVCQRTFNALTGTSLAGLRKKAQWLRYCDCLSEGRSVRKSAQLSGIDNSTAFRWRHRFLRCPTADKNQKMLGIVEADEAFFTESFKGNKQLAHRAPRKRGPCGKTRRGERVPVLIVRDRMGTVADFVYERIEKQRIHESLKPLMSEEVVLCSDGNSIYETFAREQNIPHKRLVGLANQRVIDSIFHIQNLNAYTSRLRQWLKRFNGVSTKYLDNYLGWRRLLEKKYKGRVTEFCLRQALGSN